ncbi:MAG TPA: hypothetical protein VGC91_11475 [Pyrinomonadaceae bacterium]|jgi:hypothetical protein
MKYLRRIVLLLLVLLACATFSLAQKNKTVATPATKPAAPPPEREADAANWKEFDSTTGGFSILFPDRPAESTESMGAVDAHIVRLQTFAEYSVMYADYPDPIVNEVMVHGILNSGVRNAISPDSQLLERKEISLEGNPGKYLKERLPDGKILRAKILLVGQRLFQIAITTPEEKDQTEANIKFYESVASKYLDSFKLIAAQK